MLLVIAGLVGLAGAARAGNSLSRQQLVRRSAATSTAWALQSRGVQQQQQQQVEVALHTRRLQGETVAHNLGSVPSTVAITGFSCHPNDVRDMELDPVPIRARPHYVSADGSQHLYYSDQVMGGSWIVDSDTTEANGYIASIEDSAAYPPPGAHTEWVEDCTGGPVPPPVGDDSCRYSGDSECDDGSTGLQQYCLAGTDTTDCGPPGPNSCRYSHDGEW